MAKGFPVRVEELGDRRLCALGWRRTCRGKGTLGVMSLGFRAPGPGYGMFGKSEVKPSLPILTKTHVFSPRAFICVLEFTSYLIVLHDLETMYPCISMIR